MTTVQIVALLYSPELADKSVAYARLLRTKLEQRGCSAPILAVLNNPKIDRARVSCETLMHDNTGLEFGGFQRGLEALGPLDGAGSVLFLNDTCVSHHLFGVVPRRNLVAAASDMAELPRAAAAGVVTSSQGARFSIQGLPLDRWISTWAFAINYAGLRALAGRVYDPVLSELVTGAASREDFWHPALDPQLVAHLDAWLFGGEDEHRWYAAEPLTQANAAAFARKARSILQEKYLSARLLAQDAQLRSIRPSGWPQRILHRMQCVREGRPAGFV